MSILRRNTKDLYIDESGDFVFDTEGNDFKTTKGLDYRCLEQSLFMRIESSEGEWGYSDQTAYENTLGLNMLMNFSENEIFASLENFHGLKMNSENIFLIKETIESCLEADSAFSGTNYVVSVIKITNSVVNIIIMMEVRVQLEDGSYSKGIINYSGNYNSYSKDFSIIKIDVKDNMEFLKAR